MEGAKLWLVSPPGQSGKRGVTWLGSGKVPELRSLGFTVPTIQSVRALKAA